MSNYTKATDFASKDDLLVGNPSKIVRGSEIDAEFNAIQTAVNSKADAANASLTGVPTAPTAAAGTNTTQIATTAFVLSNSPSSIPSGSVMLFVQTAAPTGWTKSTTHDNKALRVVSGTASSGGSVGFTTAFGTPTVTGSVSLSGTVGATTLTIEQIPSHTHNITLVSGDSGPYIGPNRNNLESTSTVSSGSAGGGQPHDHSFSGSGSLSSASATINVQYVDVIICTKD